MNNTPILRSLALGLLLAAATPLVQAEEVHVHEGDILPLLPCATDKANCTIALDGLGDKPLDAGTGYAIFEADFGDFPTLFSTNDPGYDHEAGEFLPGTILALRAVGALEFWNGADWSASVPAGETVTFLDALDTPLVIGAGAVPGGHALVGQFDAAGTIHEHMAMSVSTGASVGAYLVTLQLFGVEADLVTPIYGASTPFMILFNRGLSLVDFEASVDARTSPVPLPAGVWLLGSALTALGLARRRV